MKVGKRILAVASCCVLALCMLAGCQKKASEPAHQDETLEVSDSVQTAKAETEPFYVMVVGNDSRTGTVEITKPEYSDGTGRSDVLMLVRVDPKTYKVSLISVPRDTCTEYNGQKMKLNEVYHVGGVKELEKEVAKLTGVTPKYYMDMDFVQFEKFVDQLGGVTANVPINMQLVDIVSGDKIALNAGTKIGRVASARMGVFQITGANTNEEFSAGGSFNTSSRQKKARITMRIEYRIK